MKKNEKRKKNINLHFANSCFSIVSFAVRSIQDDARIDFECGRGGTRSTIHQRPIFGTHLCLV